MTDAKLPPGIDAPAPPTQGERTVAGIVLPPDVERDIHQLAARLGGMDRLRDIVSELAAR
jgi:hypothetical protein